MTGIAEVTGLLGLTDAEVVRLRARTRILRNVGFAALNLLALGCVVAGVFELRDAWQSGGDWSHFWATFLSALPICTSALRLIAVRDSRAPLYEPVRGLHVATRIIWPGLQPNRVP